MFGGWILGEGDFKGGGVRGDFRGDILITTKDNQIILKTTKYNPINTTKYYQIYHRKVAYYMPSGPKF